MFEIPNPKSAEILIEAGADVNTRDCEGRTSLHYDARDPYKEVAEALLSSGADVNARDKTGCTPLMIAERNVEKREVLRMDRVLETHFYGFNYEKEL